MIVSVAEARARGIALPSDDDAATAIIAEQEAWLTARVGLLTGSRSETFLVDGCTDALRLARYADTVTVVDGGSDLDVDDDYRFDSRSVLTRMYGDFAAKWIGPTVVATYEPSEDEVRRVLFGLIALEASPPGPYESEQIGGYSYRRSSQTGMTVPAQRAALVSSLIPKLPAAMSIPTRASHSWRPVGAS